MKLLGWILASLSVVLVIPDCLSQPFPSKPVHIVSPFPAGGTSDIVARMVGQKLSERWPQAVIVDNKPGANTIIGTEAVVKAPADGHTLLLTVDSTITTNPSLYSKLPYDPLRDLAPVTLATWSRTVIVVNGATGPKSLPDLVEFARANPGKANFGAGTITPRLAGELLKRRLGLDIVFIPYKGNADTIQGLLSGDLTFMVGAAASVMTLSLIHI